MEVIVGVACAVGGFAISYMTFQRGRDKEIKTDATENATESAKVTVKLDHISSGVDDIKIDLKTNEREINKINTELVKVNESTKSAHKRIDKLEGKE